MYFVIHLEEAKELSVLEFWSTVFVITPFVVVVSFISFKYIEKPYMNYSKRILPKK
jgi:peptidoglycan/LPS O-acetylase OafA/YrhL